MNEGQKQGQSALAEGRSHYLEKRYDEALKALSDAQGFFYEADAIDEAGLACALEGLTRKTRNISEAAFIFEDEEGQAVDPEELPDAVLVAVANGLITLASEMGEKLDFERLRACAKDLKSLAQDGFEDDHPALEYIDDVEAQLEELSQVDHGVLEEDLTKKLREHMRGYVPDEAVSEFEIRRFENGECFVAMEWLRDLNEEESERLQGRLTTFLETLGEAS